MKFPRSRFDREGHVWEFKLSSIDSDFDSDDFSEPDEPEVVSLAIPMVATSLPREFS
jgi:hypothetical protein